MTIAFGLTCEDGALLATDSLTQQHQPNGWILVDRTRRKFGELGGLIRYVASGCLPPYEPDPSWATRRLEDVAEAMLGELIRLELPAEASPGGLWHPTHLMVAGGPPGEAPGVVLVGSDRDSGLRAAIGGPPLVAGSMGAWAAETGAQFGDSPRRLEQALPFALAACRRYIAEDWRAWGFERWEDFHAEEPGGAVPPAAPPFHVALIRREGVELLEVPE